MNASETAELISALKAQGVLHFKSHDFEVHFGTDPAPLTIPKPIPEKLPYVEPPQAIDPVQTQRAQDLIDLLKLKDDDLVNKIFPDGANI
jgi:hypothetical protein